jgi:pimeloyl-ACP methyl ester carboxylesterase
MGVELADPDLLATFLPGGRVEHVPGTGHFLHLERPDVVNPLVLTHLATP